MSRQHTARRSGERTSQRTELLHEPGKVESSLISERFVKDWVRGTHMTTAAARAARRFLGTVKSSTKRDRLRCERISSSTSMHLAVSARGRVNSAERLKLSLEVDAQ